VDCSDFARHAMVLGIETLFRHSVRARHRPI
jgi:hypothetical protein